MLAGKVKNFKGPKTHYGIITQIRKDLHEKKKDMSYEYIEKAVKLFFGSYGIGHYLRYGKNCYIENFGYFAVPALVKKKFRRKRVGTAAYNQKHQRKHMKIRQRELKVQKRLKMKLCGLSLQSDLKKIRMESQLNVARRKEEHKRINNL